MLALQVPCQTFVAIDGLLVLDDILRNRTICDLVEELEGWIAGATFRSGC